MPTRSCYFSSLPPSLIPSFLSLCPAYMFNTGDALAHQSCPDNHFVLVEIKTPNKKKKKIDKREKDVKKQKRCPWDSVCCVAKTSRLVSELNIQHLWIQQKSPAPVSWVYFTQVSSPFQNRLPLVSSSPSALAPVWTHQSNSYLLGGVALFALSRQLNCVFLCSLFFLKGSAENTVTWWVSAQQGKSCYGNEDLRPVCMCMCVCKTQLYHIWGLFTTKQAKHCYQMNPAGE